MHKVEGAGCSSNSTGSSSPEQHQSPSSFHLKDCQGGEHDASQSCNTLWEKQQTKPEDSMP